MRRRPWAVVFVLAALAIAACVLRVLAAPDGLSLPRDGAEWGLRLARVACGATVGAALAVSGVLLQALLRNPLAEPAVLGLTSGAGFGVSVSLYAGYLATGAITSYAPPAIPALLGALAALAIVGALGQRRGLLDPVTLLLTGVVVSLVFGAGIVLIQHLLPDRGVSMATRWVMGALSDDVPRAWVAGVAGFTALAVAAAAAAGPAMDAASLADDEARSVGVPLGALRAGLFLLAGALAAGSVLLAGPIGFVGLVAPHLVRVTAGPAHRPLVVGASLLGAGLIVLADAAVRLVDLGGGRMPIGVLTACIGGPVFLWLLRDRARAA